MVELGKGVYSVPQAARLIGVAPQRLRRWLVGSPNGQSALPTQPEMIDGEPSLEFVDVISGLFIRAFRDEGVPLQLIRRVAVEEARRLRNDRPFSLKHFRTDGQRIYQKRRSTLLDAETGQYVMRIVFDPLLRNIKYGISGSAERWYPLGKRGLVVVDPAFALGEPTVRGVPTRVLFGPVNAGDSESLVAQWYGLTKAEVLAACEFERKMHAKAA